MGYKYNVIEREEEQEFTGFFKDAATAKKWFNTWGKHWQSKGYKFIRRQTKEEAQ